LILPLMPRQLKDIIRPLVGRDIPRWLSATFARRIALRERFHRGFESPRFPTVAQRAIYGMLRSGRSIADYERLNRFESGMAMEGRSPFNDRRLIEFALALPEEQRWRGDRTKVVLREATRDLLPASVRHRMSKADFSYLYPETFAREEVGERFKSLRLVSDGFIDAPQARKIGHQACQGAVHYFDPVWMILAIECWYRTMFPDRSVTTG
jgi:asparagine synthetase B (glutamine-hydrolysing)